MNLVFILKIWYLFLILHKLIRVWVSRKLHGYLSRRKILWKSWNLQTLWVSRELLPWQLYWFLSLWVEACLLFCYCFVCICLWSSYTLSDCCLFLGYIKDMKTIYNRYINVYTGMVYDRPPICFGRKFACFLLWFDISISTIFAVHRI